MKIEKIASKNGLTTSRLIYNDELGVSELFLPTIWIDFWSKDRKYWLKTVLGEKIAVFDDDLRKINLKLVLQDVGTVEKPKFKTFMSVNSPRRCGKRIPMLSLAQKLNKIWRGTINVEREYRERARNGYRYWEG